MVKAADLKELFKEVYRQFCAFERDEVTSEPCIAEKWVRLIALYNCNKGMKTTTSLLKHRNNSNSRVKNFLPFTFNRSNFGKNKA